MLASKNRKQAPHAYRATNSPQLVSRRGSAATDTAPASAQRHSQRSKRPMRLAVWGCLLFSFNACTNVIEAPLATDAIGAPDAHHAPRDAAPLADAPAPPTDATPVPPDDDSDAMVNYAAKLYSPDGQAFRVQQITAAIERAQNGAARPVILYVHGRACGGGGEPRKSLEDAVPKMAASYSAAVVMFVWPGADDGCPLGFPEDRARASGKALVAALRAVRAYRAAHPATPLTLITHSMGSLVLEAAAPTLGALPQNTVDHVIVNSAASAAKNHAAWVGKLTFARNVYVTVNDNDSVLRSAGLGNGVRLGKNTDDATLASRATYVDFTANEVNHAYYLVGGQNGATMKAFYRAVMKGQPFTFTGQVGIARSRERNGATTYYFNGR